MKPSHFGFTLVLFLVLNFFSLSGQEDSTKVKKDIPSYIDISFGLKRSEFRDFATSPLFYQGNPFSLGIGYLDLDLTRESGFNGFYSKGTYSNSYNNTYSESSTSHFSGTYRELFKLKKLSTSNFHLKIGSQINGVVVVRENEDLRNNRTGFDVLSNLSLSTTGTFDISRNKQKDFHFLFIKSKLEPRKRYISIGMDYGLIKLNYRNGFIYTRHSPILNDDAATEGYEIQFMKGAMINGMMDYSVFLKNGNALRLRYLWNYMRTDTDQDYFEMANHGLILSMLFNLN